MNMCLERASFDVGNETLCRFNDNLLKQSKVEEDECNFVKSDYKMYNADLLLSCSPIIMFGMAFVLAMLL